MLFDTFRDTIFLKESSDLQAQCDALEKLSKEYPDNDAIQEELFLAKKGLTGEQEIEYQLKKCNLGLVVLHDINLKYDDLTAQIDYIVFTKNNCYFIECKNLIGNITVNEKGDFIREYTFKGHKIEKGMYSPFRQVEAQRDVFKKIWNNGPEGSGGIFHKILRGIQGDSSFYDWYKILVVAANSETILDTSKAPKDMKYKILRADSLVRQLQYDLDHSNKSDWMNKNGMLNWAENILNQNINKNIDYYQYYKEKIIGITVESDESLRNRLIEFRKVRSNLMNIPAYYVFTDKELDEIIKVRPTDFEAINSILSPPNKARIHGQAIIDWINKRED